MPLSKNSQQGQASPKNAKHSKAKHFLHSAALRDFTLNDLQGLTEDRAFILFQKLRWGGLERQSCSHCAAIDSHYYKRTRKRWLCKHCLCEFSVTTGTVFQDRKLRFSTILYALLLYITSTKGKAARELSAQTGMAVKTAFVLLMKVRELFVRTNPQSELFGTVHIDGAHFCGKPRRPNRRRRPSTAAIEAKLLAGKKSSKNRAHQKHNPKRRIMISLRQIGTEDGHGAIKTIAVVCMAESEIYARALAEQYIKPGSIVMSDENPAYNNYSADYDHRTVQHSREYSAADGTNNNQAESFNSRLRRAEYGTYHGFRPKYFGDYVQEGVWLEDMRRKTNLEKIMDVFERLGKAGLSRWWRGYWQGYHRLGELLFDAGSDLRKDAQ